MPWNPLTEDMVKKQILPDEITLLTAIQGGTDILASILPNVIAQLQAQILVGGNQIGPVGTVPDQILQDAIALARWEWFSSLPNTDLLSESRKAQKDRAEKHMEKIVTGEEKVEIPAAPQVVTGPSHRVEIIRRGHRLATHDYDTLGSS